jgi:hypothetical protein
MKALQPLILVVVSTLGVAGAFGSFVLSRAEAMSSDATERAEKVDARVTLQDQGTRDELRLMRDEADRRASRTEDQVNRVEAKVDDVLKELRRKK